MTETPRDNEETIATTPVGKVENFVSKHFVRLLVWLAVSGGALAIFGPWLLYVAGCTGETDANLRLHILYVTGGTIAVLGLIETHRKNTTDRIKAEADIQSYQASQDHQAKTLNEQTRQFNETIAKEREKIEADKAKNEQDHIRQVHAERRSRYSTAIEQLSNDKASIRLGGVYTLVGLVDEWLADEKTIPNIEERRKEGQVIINNLCAYIRSPFDLASKHKELSKEHQAPENYEGGTEQFSEDQGRFREEQDIRLGIMQEMRNRLRNRLHSLENDSGPWSNFDYNFTNATFFYEIDLSGASFTSEANFSEAKFNKITTFYGANFKSGANFTRAKFIKNTTFDFVLFDTDVTYREISFIQAEFIENATFKNVTFNGRANFAKSIFNKDSIFTEIVVNKKDFYFSGGIIFTGVRFEQEPNFFMSSSDLDFPSRFILGSENEFSVAENSSTIDIKEHRSPDGIITTIPRGCIVFDDTYTEIPHTPQKN